MNKDPGNVFWSSSYAPLLVFIISFIIGFPSAFFTPFPHHEGSILYPAYMINHGLVPLRDVIIQHPPTTAYMYAFAFKIFGDYLIVSRLLTLAVTAAIVTTVFLLCKRFCSHKTAFIYSLCYLVSTYLLWDLTTRPWPTHWAVLFFLLTVLALIKWIETNCQKWIAVSSIFLGLVLCVRLNIGIYAIIILTSAIIIILKRDSPNDFKKAYFPVVLFICPAIFLCSCVFGFFFFLIDDAQILKYFFEFQYSLPKIHKILTDYKLYSPLNDLGLSKHGVFFAILSIMIYLPLFNKLITQKIVDYKYVVISCLLIFLALLLMVTERSYYLAAGPSVIGAGLYNYYINRNKWHEKFANKYLILIFGSITTWGIMYPGGDHRYFAWAGIFIAIIAGEYIYSKYESIRCLKGLPKKNITLIAILMMLYLVGIPGHFHHFNSFYNTQWSMIHDGFYKYMMADIINVQDYVSLREYILLHSKEDDKIIMWQAESLHYAYLERKPATLPYISLDNLVYLTQSGRSIEAKLLEKIKKDPPAFVIVEPPGGTADGGEVFIRWHQGAFQNLKDYIDDNYTFAWKSQNNKYTILRIK